MKSRILLLFLPFLLFACKAKKRDVSHNLPFFTTADFTPRWMDADSVSHHLAPFSFTDQDGKTITEQTVKGKIHVADFFYTTCPGICPRLTKNLGLIQDAYKNDSTVVLLSYSVTSDHDSVSVLKEYATLKGIISGKWHLLTGNQDSINTLARNSYFAEKTLGQEKGVDDFLHTENVLLVDKQLRIRGIYNGTLPFDMEQLVKDIKQLEKEE